MTREEAITVLERLANNSLFSNQHKAAFNIAIHDIKAYQKWNLNELVLTSKDNKQEPILEKIREQIMSNLKSVDIALEVLAEKHPLRQKMEGAKDTLVDCLELIDKAETEAEDGECK